MAGTGPAGGDRESSVWGPSYAQQTHYLWVYLARLRRKLEPDTAQYTELDSAVALHARIGRTQPFPDRPDNDERIAAVLGPAYEVQEPIAGRTHPGRITDTAEAVFGLTLRTWAAWGGHREGGPHLVGECHRDTKLLRRRSNDPG